MIFQYWHSEYIPDEVLELTATFRDHNPTLEHLLLCESEADAFISEHFGAREVAAFRACAVPAMQADYFRYCAVLALGGIYADVGFRCRRSLQTLLDARDDGGLFRLPGNPAVIINGFFFFKRGGHPLPQLALDIATANIECRTVDKVNLATGPAIFSGLVKLHELGSFDALRKGVARSDMGRLVEIPLRAIEDFKRVEHALEGVRIESLSSIDDWVERPSSTLPYKRSGARWVDWPTQVGSIFR